MKKRMAWVLVVTVWALLTGAAFAQFAKTEDAIKYRQSVMSVTGTHFSRMGAMVRGDAAYVKDAFEQNANLVASLLALPWEAFMMDGSYKGSATKPEVLAQKDKFMQLAKANQTEVSKLMAAAKAGDMNAIKPQFGAAGASCKACHDAYRSK
jgi:cytochrome c556